jgi:hypothetical protein
VTKCWLRPDPPSLSSHLIHLPSVYFGVLGLEGFLATRGPHTGLFGSRDRSKWSGGLFPYQSDWGCAASSSIYPAPPPPLSIGALIVIFQNHLTGQNPFIDRDNSLFTNERILVRGCFSLLWTDQHIGILQISSVDRQRIFVDSHFLKTQLSFINGRLDLLTENITIVSSVRVRIVPHAISFSFQLIQRRYSM